MSAERAEPLGDAGAGPGPTRRSRRENAFVLLLRIPVFRRMWAAIAFSSLGDWLGLLANTALAQQLTREQSRLAQGFAISGVILVRLTPDLFFGALAAALADKLDRRKTAIIGDLTAGVLYASIAVGYNLVWLYVAQFVIEAVGLFTQPAKQVIWVAIVPKKLLATANQVSLFSVYGTVPVAAAAFALLSAVSRLIGGEHSIHPGGTNPAIVIALVLNAVTFLVSATTVFVSRHAIPVVPHQHEQEQGIFSLLREGVSFVRHDPLIRGLYVGIIGAFAAGGLTAGVAQLWVTTLDAGTAGYAIMFGTLFTGLAVGILVGPRVLPTYTRSRVFGLAIGGAGVTLLIMSLIRDFVLADILAALVGLFAGMAWIIGYTLIGQEVEDRLRGRTFAFVLSSVRLMLFLTIAVGPIFAGLFGSHSVPVGKNSRLTFSGPGLTLLLGGVVALAVSFYATSRASGSPAKLRELLRRRLINTGMGRHPDHTGLFVTVDGLDADATAGYAALVAATVRARRLVLSETSEPTDSPTGRRVEELLLAAANDGAAGVEPETAALLSAADRAEHVASVIRPALERGEVVVCDRFVLTSLALHGGGRGADVDRIRAVNAWSTGGLQPDLTLVVVAGAGEPDDDRGVWLTGAPDDLDAGAARVTLLAEAEASPDRYLICPAEQTDELPLAVRERLGRLLDNRSRVIADVITGAVRGQLADIDLTLELAEPVAADTAGEPVGPGSERSGTAPRPTSRRDSVQPVPTAATTWQRSDTEAVPCCVCQREGRPLYDLDPFGVVRCPRCTLVFVSPRLRPEALQRLYDEPAYHEGVYGAPSRFSPAMFLQRQWTSGRLALATRELGRPARGARLLEVGSGHGFFLDAARTAGYDVAGVELSVTAARHAREHLGLTVHSTQLADAPLDGRFDVVCAWDTLEHVPDPVEFWTAVGRLVADDGVVLFSTPYFSSLPSRLLRANWWTLKPTEHIWHFTPRTHRTVAAAAGLRVDRVVRNPLARANFSRLDSLVGVARKSL